MTDLPRTDLTQLEGQRGSNPPIPERRGPGTVQAHAGGHPASWHFWLGFAVVASVIWLIGGATGGPWFLWVVIPLAFIMLRRWIMGAERRTRDHQDDHQGRQ